MPLHGEGEGDSVGPVFTGEPIAPDQEIDLLVRNLNSNNAQPRGLALAAAAHAQARPEGRPGRLMRVTLRAGCFSP